MPMDDDDRDDLTEADRRAISDIRRQLDAEFGPLEGAPPLAEEWRPHAGAPRPPATRAETERIADRALRSVAPRRRAAPTTFLLGALVAGLVGGVAGGATTLWMLDGVALRSAPEAPTESPAAAPSPRPDARVALDAALAEWLDATRRGDIESQMRFYPDRVPVYYTWRDVPHEAVRQEKQKVFGAATQLEIATDRPVIELTDGGRSAVTRFRKRFVIEGPVIRRRGEVLQELRWTRTADGWRIVAERDAQVLAP